MRRRDTRSRAGQAQVRQTQAARRALQNPAQLTQQRTPRSPPLFSSSSHTKRTPVHETHHTYACTQRQSGSGPAAGPPVQGRSQGRQSGRPRTRRAAYREKEGAQCAADSGTEEGSRTCPEKHGGAQGLGRRCPSEKESGTQRAEHS